MGVDLAAQGKSEWARQEFTSLLTWAPTERVDPWRRTSGMNTLRSRRSVAIVRELWYARDDIARERDTSIGRVLPDAALVEIAQGRAEHRGRPAPRAPGDRPLRPPVGRGGAPRRRDPRGRPAAAHAAVRRPAAAAGLGREEPRGRRPAGGHPGRADRVRRRSTSSRSRTSARPTRCAGSCGSRRPTTTRPPSPGPCSTRACRPWQAEIVAPMLVAAFAQFPDCLTALPVRRHRPTRPRPSIRVSGTRRDVDRQVATCLLSRTWMTRMPCSRRWPTPPGGPCSTPWPSATARPCSSCAPAWRRAHGLTSSRRRSPSTSTSSRRPGSCTGGARAATPSTTSTPLPWRPLRERWRRPDERT